MSLITRCPSCGTQFKVVPDQLKVSHGWVRCGHCAEVFDASVRLEKIPVPTAPAEPVQPQPQHNPSDAIDSIATNAENTLDNSDFFAVDEEPYTTTSPQDTTPSALRPQPRELPVDTFASFADELSALAERANQRQPVGQAPGASQFDLDSVVEWSASKPELPESDERFADSAPSGDPDAQHAELSQLGFVRQARRKAFWRHPAVRLVSALLCVALSTLLAAQMAVQQRDELSVAQPQLKPYLQQLCEWVGCKIQPLKRIELIAIDSSAFNKAQADTRQETYRLSFVLKNNAAVPLMAPSLELTLTDTQDTPVLRRTLAPAEYGARTELIAAGAELNSSVALGVNLSVAALPPGRVIGYRLLAFYP